MPLSLHVPSCQTNRRPSPIRTIPSAPESHRVLPCGSRACVGTPPSPPIRNFTLPRRSSDYVAVATYIDYDTVKMGWCQPPSQTRLKMGNVEKTFGNARVCLLPHCFWCNRIVLMLYVKRLYHYGYLRRNLVLTGAGRPFFSQLDHRVLLSGVLCYATRLDCALSET